MIFQEENKKKMNKFESCIRPRLDEIGKLLKQGMSTGELASSLGISVSTLRRYRRSEPELAALFEEVRSKEDDLVEAALLKRATGYENADGKEIPPDVRAAVFWLKNRRPQEWKDRRELSLDQPLEIRFSREEQQL